MYAEFHNELAKGVLRDRYLWETDNGTESWSDMCRRVARVLAENEKDRAMWEQRFYDLMVNGDFLPNSPTLMNAGEAGALLSACFVLPIEDSMESIFGTLKDMALIHRDGGGTGFSFSRLRPVRARVKKRGKSSGVVSFLKVYNGAGITIEQGGKRRGANMGMLRVDHPEIVQFIRAKEVDGELANFNLSVAITDEFMHQLRDNPQQPWYCYHEKTGFVWLDRDGDWHSTTEVPVSERALKVEDIWRMICEHAWANGEPGVFFVDTANKGNPIPSAGQIETTNPCGEQPMVPYLSCNLGSINLANFYNYAAEGIDFARLRSTIHTSVRLLDNVVDVNYYPIPEIDEMTRKYRPIGLGLMGFADLLIKMGIKYGSEESYDIADRLGSFIEKEAWAASEGLAEEKGACLGTNFESRNCQVTSIAPTGTLSILAVCSSGIEPNFAWSYNRKSAGKDYVEAHPLAVSHDELPDYFVTANEVPWEDHVRMQATWQKYIDTGISKTINMSLTATVEDVAAAIRMAWESECKGITVYRDGSRAGQVISLAKVIEEPELFTIEQENIQRGEVLERPRVTDGATVRYRIACGHLYVTYNHINGVPCEVFVQPGEDGGCVANSKAIGMLISTALRGGIDPDRIIRTLKKVSCPACRGKKGLDAKSCAAAIAKAMTDLAPGFAGGEEDVPMWLSLECPDCGGEICHEGGCVVCKTCGFSKCG